MYTLYAHWTVNTNKSKTYMVTFDPNGGTGYQDQKVVCSGSYYRALPTPTKNGSHFMGWYTTKSSGGKEVAEDDRVALTDNRTLYARWQSSASVRRTETGSSLL